MYVIMKNCLVWITIQCFNSDWLIDWLIDYRVTWGEQFYSYSHYKLKKPSYCKKVSHGMSYRWELIWSQWNQYNVVCSVIYSTMVHQLPLITSYCSLGAGGCKLYFTCWELAKSLQMRHSYTSSPKWQF
jgi:hypothetical protein